ncbi:hypothetical protein Q6348_10970 [Isoptericola sp. b441]|uniref:Uncharacterized protein n=1 Tax=Actinotalea lenta TaxID=3064654 RepID=A0ABT9D9Y6_9CELL|nr:MULTISPECIES: hypothetical protein [unclassified Isoptericola]MDO8107717.1 hypothetical protein [Isoptericola sp. b441]MDO8120612.1 hypothetical protein [Isoptericola sp. b490]
MDRDVAREELLLRLVGSRADAARVRARVDSSAFGEHSALVMLVADHDVHVPEAPPSGEERRAALLAYVHALAEAGRRHARPRSAHRHVDPRWELAGSAYRDLLALPRRGPGGPDLDALLEALTTDPEVPRQAGRDRRIPRPRRR